ncbi:MAG: TolB family protein [Bacteroidota bacterium]
MRHVPIPWRTGWAVLGLVLWLVIGCGKDRVTGPPPPPQLTSPRIAFISDRSGTQGIYLLDPSTRNVVGLTPPGVYDADPAISPDGRRIAFATPVGAVNRLMTMAVDGTNRVLCGANAQFGASQPHWSPDGKRIVFTGTSYATGAANVYTILATGDSLLALTSNGVSHAFAWSPDGSRILYVSRRAPDASYAFPIDTLRDVTPDGTTVRTLLVLALDFIGADYSPDGSHIVFDYWDFSRGFSIEICDEDGASRVVAARGNPDLEGLSAPSWSPDGAAIVFSAHLSGLSGDLYTATPTPGDPQLFLAGTAADMTPNWGPRP